MKLLSFAGNCLLVDNVLKRVGVFDLQEDLAAVDVVIDPEENRNGVAVPVEESVKQGQVGRRLRRRAFIATLSLGLDDLRDGAAAGNDRRPQAVLFFIQQNETG